jgi:hypothetical protein
LQTFCSDRQTVSELEGTLFELQQDGAVQGFVMLKNIGVNDIDYRFQAMVSGSWSDLGQSGTDVYNTLVAGDSIAVLLTTTLTGSSRVRVRGAADAGSTLQFSVSRYFIRGDGGNIPILSL